MPISSLFVAVFLIAAASTAVATDPQCTPFSSITALTFLESQTTATRRRTSNIPTLNCIGNCPEDAQLKAAQCMQIGLSDFGTPSWKCIPQFARSTSAVDGRRSRFGFGTVRVECEGCSTRGDLDVVKGSCALFYSVVDTTPSSQHRGRHFHGDHYHTANTADILTSLLFFSFLIFACVVGRRMCCSNGSSAVHHYGDSYPYKDGQGAPVQGYPVGSAGAHHHYYGGGSSGGFGTGMLTGLVVGDMLSRPYHNHYGDGGYGYGGGSYNESSYDDGSWGGGWGSSDGAGYGGGDSI